VRVSTVAVSQGNLTVSISETAGEPAAPLSAPDGRGPRTRVGVQRCKNLRWSRSVSLQQLVDGLNALRLGRAT